MAFPDPTINAAFIAIADRYATGELTVEQFRAATQQMLVDYGLVLPERHDIDDDDEPSR